MKRSITIPSTLHDVTLETYQRVVEIEEPTDEQLVGVFCNMEAQEVLALPSRVYDKALDSISNIISQITDSKTLVKQFKLKGVHYGMIPNLDEISYGENKDLTSYLGDWKTMHLAMTVLYRPIVKSSFDTYSIKEYEGTKEHRDTISQMPLDIVLGAQLFFYNLTRDLLRAIPNYLEKVVEQEEVQTHPQTTKVSGEDMMKSITSLKETLEGLMR